MNGLHIASRVRQTVLAAALALATALDLHALALALASHTRLREAATSRIDRTLSTSRGRWGALVRAEDAASVEMGLRALMDAVAAESGEVWDPNGLRLSLPRAAGPNPRGLAEGRVLLAGGPQACVVGADGKAVCWSRLEGAPLPIFVRVVVPVPELQHDLRQRHQLLVSQGAVLLLLIVLAAGMASPGRPEAPAAPPAALLAYEAAMERLRSHGERLSHDHEDERRRIGEELRDKETLARAGELTAGIVHEVRNGLGTIIGYARLLEGDADPQRAEHVQAIRQECASLEVVVRRFTEFIKSEALIAGPVDLYRVLTRVVGREIQARSGAAVELSVAPGLRTQGDEDLLERAFENLVRNAREAAGASGNVRVSAGVSGSMAEVVVADDGPGMSATARAGLRPLVSTKPGGLGLGLAITLKIVRLHGGELVLADHAPRGLSAIVRLPIGEVAA